MEFKHDQQADAVYVRLASQPYAYGRDLDDDRRVDYASDDTAIGIELLSVSTGVSVDGLPFADEVAELLERNGIKVYATAAVQLKQEITQRLVTVLEFPIPIGDVAAEYSVKLWPGGDTPWTSTLHSYAIMPK